MRVGLSVHPATPSTAIDRIEVQLIREQTILWLRYTAVGDVERVAWPTGSGSARMNDLWKHTCFEAFVSSDTGYREFNLSPSSQWASYAFDGYRQGMGAADETVVVQILEKGADYVALESRIELPLGARRLGLSAVIEAIDGSFSYWALAHPSDKPDFHHPDSFVLELP